MQLNITSKMMAMHKWAYMIFLAIFIFGYMGAMTHSRAQEIQVKGVATTPYKSSLFSSKPNGEAVAQSQQQAEKAAWDKYTSRFNAARMKIYLDHKQEILSQLDNYISESRVIDQFIDKEAKSIRTVVRISVNEAAVVGYLDRFSVSGQSATGEGSAFVFLFLAREGDKIKSFDEKRTVIEKSETASKASESLNANGGAVLSTATTKDMSKTTTGGSTERKKSQITYSVSSSEDIDTAFGDVLSTAGFEIIAYDDVVSACGGVESTDIQQEFSQSDAMSRSVRKQAIAAMRECEVPLFAVGVMDAGVQDIDPVSGQKRVYVSVRGQVWNLSKKLPRKVASVGPVQFAGLGPDDQVAKRNALILAAQEASRTIVDQLNAKSIH